MALEFGPLYDPDHRPPQPRRPQAKARPIAREHDYEELSDAALFTVGAVFWAFVALVAGMWLRF